LSNRSVAKTALWTRDEPISNMPADDLGIGAKLLDPIRELVNKRSFVLTRSIKTSFSDATEFSPPMSVRQIISCPHSLADFRNTARAERDTVLAHGFEISNLIR